MTSLPRARRLALCLALRHVRAGDGGRGHRRGTRPRLQALEQRLGTAPATTDRHRLADLDQRLRVIERKLELQAEEAAAKAAKDAGGQPQRSQGPVGQVAGRRAASR